MVCHVIFSEEQYTQPVFTCWKLTIETPEQGVKYVQSSQYRHFNFEHISRLVLVFPLLTLNM